MRKDQTTKNCLAKLMLCAALFLGLNESANAQINALYSATLMSDSLVASSNKDFLYNTVTITNTAPDKLNMTVTITTPGKWSLVSDNVINVNLDQNGSLIIPMRLMSGNGNTAAWQQVKIEYRNNANGQIKNDFFKVRVQEFSKFKAILTSPNLVLAAFQKNIYVPVYIKNSGNTANEYTIVCKNEYLHLDSKTTITVKAGADTTYSLPLTMTEKEYSMLKKEEVSVVVSCKKDVYNLPQIICKIGSVEKEHSSAYQDMPLQLEAGAIYQGKGTAPQYYGGLYGSVDLDKTDRISVAYRSNTISSTQNVDNGMMKLDYTGAHLSASVGNIQEMSDFPMNGYGIKAGYNWNTTDKLVVYGIVKSKNGDNNIMGGVYQRMISKKIKLNENVSTDIDRTAKLNSTIVRQTVDVQIDEHTKISAITAGSLEQNTAEMLGGQNNVQAGSAFGYDLRYSNKYLNVVSSIVDNSNGFAGIYKGQRVQNHDLRLTDKTVFAGAYYEGNYNKQNYFVDSVLLKNIFNISTTNYGVRTGWSGKHGNIVLSAGNQKQTQSGEGNNFETNYNYLNANTSIFLAKKINLMFNTFAGEGSIASKGISNIFSTSTQGTLQVYNGGMTFQYNKGPFYYNDYVTYLQTKQSVSHFIFSPYTDMNFMKGAFTGRLQYNYSGASDGSPATSTVLVNLAYNNFSKGYDFHLTGMIPTGTQTTVQPYVTATVRCRITTAFPLIKKYHTVKIFLFKDVNNDGIWEQYEDPIVGQTISINGNLFVSDENGMITYKNVEDGIYKADMGYNSKVKGWTPSAGNIQKIEIDGDNAMEHIAFRKSRVLDGSLKVIIDSNSGLKFSPGSIKVTVTTSGSETYTTLTDEDGNFSFNLPEGNYTVSISPASFDEYFRPTEFSKNVDLTNNTSKKVFFEIRQKRRQINIKKG